jgi:hypothetical protein
MLESIINEYPYFQAAHSVYLKALHNQSSPQYNKELQITAAHTTDRSVLFDFITSQDFVQNRISERIKKQQEQLEEIEVDSEEVKVKEEDLNANKDFKQVTDVDLFQKKQNISDRPLNFPANEKHSFAEWLKLTTLQPIDRSSTDVENNQQTAHIEEEERIRQEKMRRIDQFLADKPRIVPKKNEPSPNPKIEPYDSSQHLMTETLAKVYLAQKNYDKALKAYEILVLQHPEKSGFFADRIQEIKNLQSST